MIIRLAILPGLPQPTEVGNFADLGSVG